MEKQEIEKMIAENIPKTFGLYAFKDRVFRVHPEWTKHLLYNDPVELVVQVAGDDGGEWLDFSRGSIAEIKSGFTNESWQDFESLQEGV